MRNWKKPVLINAAVVAVVLLYNIVTTTGPRGGEDYFPRLAFSGIIILLLAPVNLVVGMVRNRNRRGDGPVYLLLAGLLLLIGFSVCTVQ